MRKYVTAAFMGISFLAAAQEVTFSLSTGSGMAYIFESRDKSVDVTYSMPLSFMGEMSYTPKGRTWWIKARVLQTESSVTGENWVNKTPLNGYA